ncbi:lipoprotein-releasing ABC transporter permease subunit [Sandaracinobacter sp. RS1-74]|uniref:lipoprotein-releasing ABC transporter permease subunit n=1 Tax=Sandaracinobacteroides sayramensis TaxID=2913411 RepID=UPI001EDA0571|nr:lipoprotein-releasing ABC transporter permease subunit [Sandaracinobacteroides sayramensis]MCG2841677.1 lipoprotein-releasing ABC transporter permease subunit [Sandaracinobacteroides sayramensis]
MIARRYLLPGQGERFIVLVAGISLVAVALGVAALIAVMSVMNGFRAELFDRFQGLNGHAVAQGYGGRLPDWQRVVDLALETPGVTSATPLIEQPLMASANGRVEGVLVRGMRVEDILKTDVIAQTVQSGDINRLKPGDPVAAIGARLAENLGVKVGDRIALIAPQGTVTPFGTVPRIVSYEIVATFEIGIYDFDKAFVVLPLDQAQILFDLGEDVGMVMMTSINPDRIDQYMRPLAEKIGLSALITDWRQLNSALFEALIVEQVVMFWVLSIIILVAVFNILSSLIMLVRAKTRDIAILRTMGASRGALMRVFMMVGTSIGALGVLLGLALGFLVLHFRQQIVGGFAAISGTNLWDPSVRYLTELPAKTDPAEVVGTVLLTLALAFLATIYPAWKAASTDPVTVLRYE